MTFCRKCIQDLGDYTAKVFSWDERIHTAPAPPGGGLDMPGPGLGITPSNGVCGSCGRRRGMKSELDWSVGWFAVFPMPVSNPTLC